jgi:hypothetical protein
MKRRHGPRSLALVIFAALCLCQAGAGEKPASLVGAKDLLEKGGAFDGQLIFFEGEALGPPIAAGDLAMVELKDSTAKLQAWMPRALLSRIVSYASYKARGDVIRVKGRFNLACPDHGGARDIHVESLEVVSRGGTVGRILGGSMGLLVPLGLAAAGGMWLLWRRRDAKVRRTLERYAASMKDRDRPGRGEQP